MAAALGISEYYGKEDLAELVNWHWVRMYIHYLKRWILYGAKRPPQRVDTLLLTLFKKMFLYSVDFSTAYIELRSNRYKYYCLILLDYGKKRFNEN